MSTYIIWWIFALVLVALELTIGTFYLLVYGLAAAAAGLAGWLGLGIIAQLVVAAIIGIAGTIALKKWRQPEGTEANTQDLDIGQSVTLEQWQGSKGQVKYRGAAWDAEAANAEVDTARPLYIRAIRGNVLIVGN